MKVLFHNTVPFALAHGGMQSQIVRTKEALEKLGVEVEYLRFYDATQTGDIIHLFGRIPMSMFTQAKLKRFKIVMSDLLTAQGSRSPAKLKMQNVARRFLQKAAPSMSANFFNWPIYQESDACVALTAWEAQLMHDLFGAPRERVHVIPNGVEEIFLESQPATRGQWLVCTATITERKRVLELAEAAVRAQSPVWIIGKAYSENDLYAQRFFELAKREPKFVRFEGAVTDRARMAQVYREARGFVLLSAMESLSLSALEAAACECPLLLSDLPWARTTFKENASYCPITSTANTAETLRKFYDATPGLKSPPKPLTWLEVGRQFKTLYETLASTSR